MSKGSRPKSYSVSLKEFDKKFDAIFCKPDPRVIEDAEAEEEAFKLIEEAIKRRDEKNNGL